MLLLTRAKSALTETFFNQPNMDNFAWKISFGFFFFLSTLTFNGIICSGNSKIHCHESDRRLLQIFKEGVNDPCNLLSLWSTQKDCYAWEGVHCDNITGRVTKLNVKDHLTEGEINLSLLELEFLNYLDLSDNSFKAVRYRNQSLATTHLYSNFIP